jgi:glycosyltransferase involved in cell wall biosynthesis
MRISFCVITLNEADNLSRCLASIQDVADEIVVLDSGSEDGTREVAAQYKCRWEHQDWLGYVGQKNKVLSLASHEWVFSIDADESLSEELRREIVELKKREPPDSVSGFSAPRCVCYEGRWIRHGDWYPDRLVRLFRRSRAKFAGGRVHERLEVEGAVENLRGDLRHYSFRDRDDHWARCQKYARLWAETEFEAGRKCGRLAAPARAAFRWFRGYVWKAGFLDGPLGWRIAVFCAKEVFLKYRLLGQLNREGRRPLRVVQLNTLFKGGGVDNQSLELAAGLRDLGHHVWLAVPPDRPLEPHARHLGLALAHLPATRNLLLFPAIARLLQRENIDVIHAHHGRDYWRAIFAAKLGGRGTRVVVTRHLAAPPSASSRWFLPGMVDAIVAVSRHVEEILRTSMKGSPKKIHMIYGGIDVAAFASPPSGAVEAFRASLGWKPDNVVCGVVGTFSFPRGKGQLEFLEAARQLTAEFPPARFAIIGTGSMKTLLETRITAMQLDGVVKLVPFRYDMPVVMNALDALVHPALGTEALGLVLLEAMAAGKPVIASRLGGIPEAFNDGEHGLLVRPDDISDLTRAMRTLLADKSLREKMGNAGRGHVAKNFSRQGHAARIVELYLNLA